MINSIEGLTLLMALELNGLAKDRIETICPKHTDDRNNISMDIISTSRMLTVSCDACDKVFYVQAGFK